MKLRYIIELSPGSEYQRRIWGRLIKNFLTGLGATLEREHSGNKLTVKKLDHEESI